MIRRTTQLAITAAILLAALIPAGDAQAGAPAWQIRLASHPTNLAPGASSGSQYSAVIVNVGGAASSGPVTFTDVLPEGVMPTGIHAVDNSGTSGFSCATISQTVTCTYSKRVSPGEFLNIEPIFTVDSGLPEDSTLTNEVTVSGGGAVDATATTTTTISSAPALFGFLPDANGFRALLTEDDGSPSTQAGGHPTQLTVDLGFPTVAPGGQFFAPDGGIHTGRTFLPPGLIVNPSATPVRCTETQLEGSGCPDASAVGVAEPFVPVGTPVSIPSPLYNMVPPPGEAASLAFNGVRQGIFVHLLGGVRAGDYTLFATGNDILSRSGNPVLGLKIQLWGDPSSPIHDHERSECANHGGVCPVPQQSTPFLTTPTTCTSSITADAGIDSWEHPNDFHERSAQLTDLEGNATEVSGCNALEFAPTLKARPTTNVADSPSGLDVDLHIPQPPPANLVGKTYSCTSGTWENNPTGFSYQWLRNGVPIPGATSSEYPTQESDAAAPLQCEVEATNAGVGAGLAVSAPVLVQPTPDASPPVPGVLAVSGSVTSEGGTLTCEPGNWQGSPSFTYQWFKDGAPVVGETESTYKVASGEAPLTLQCEVIGTNGVGTVVAFSQNAISSPPPSPPLPRFTIDPQAYLPQSEFPLGTAHLRKAVVTLPEGLVVNPSGANGLSGCSAAQIGIDPQSGTADGNSPNCPNASKIGSVEVDTPLLDHPLPGAVYIATPYDNPFDSLLAIYIAIDDPETGVIVKLVGHVEAGLSTGRLTTTFDENPQLPFEDFKLHFFGGASAALRTPATCGTYSTTSSLTPWSAPESGPPATPSDVYPISQALDGGSCATSASAQPNTPAFNAGTISPSAGAYSPFLVNLRRGDGSQELSSLTLTPPPGLVGKLAGTPYCPDSVLAAAAAKSGNAEKANPSCPAASQVGTVDVSAGAGPTPYNTTGKAYLAPPYKGAPLSLAIVTPATAGPYDLGTVVVRTALEIDPVTAQITAVSDPIPHILQGIPLDLRSVAVRLDKPDFSLNPTSCDPMSIDGAAISIRGQSAALANPFQVGGCSSLPFKPRFALRLREGTKRASHPRLIATLNSKPGEANIAKASVTLPRSAFLDQAHIRTICTRVQFASETCPKGSIYGSATATTPLLDYPISGNVYLRSSDHKLPDLVVALKGPASQPIEVDLDGRTDSIKGALRNTFEAVPDAPVSKFRLELFGGKRGLVVNSRDLCAHVYHADVRLDGQNGKTYDTAPVVKSDCKKVKRHRGHHKKRSQK